MDFLAEDNTCGQSLLILVARGSAILAELQRLSENIPKLILTRSPEYKKYEKILFTFEYLKNIDELEDQIQRNQEIQELDETFKKSYLPLIERFYRLFESIYLYYSDLMAFIEELQEAVFIQYSVETVLQDVEGKKLFAESFYLYGCMLILMDNLIPGEAREKLLIAYYRFKGGQSAIQYINEVTKMCADTGFTPNGKRPPFYPEEYFARFPMPEELMAEILNSIKDDDIYKLTSIYPSAEHRSTALANQGAILYVMLYFCPKILQSQNAKMREIVDKHFYDCWVVPYYLGYYVDLSVQWEPYKAAKLAITNTIELGYIKEMVAYNEVKLQECIQKVQDFLYEGQITVEFVLEKITALMNCVRECNIVIRWVMLHQNTSIVKAQEILSKINKGDILTLLMQSSKFENRLLKTIQSIIDDKQVIWDEDKGRCVERMQELSEYFSGKALGKVKVDESYVAWFAEMANQSQQLNYQDSTHAGRKIQRLIKALEDIEQYPQISTSIQVKHYLAETRNDLKHMVKIVHIKNYLPTHISFIADFSYSWQCLKSYQTLMQDKIQQNPNCALSLKTTFQKLSSILNTPTIRIIQAQSPDLNSVSKYYSGELVKFVKEVLQIIPIQVFEILQDIIILITSVLKPLPSKVNKMELKDYAQYEDRNQIAKLTNSIAVFTESILTVEAYLLGSIEVNPREMLDQGVRKELMSLIHKMLDSALYFSLGTQQDFQSRLTKLADDIGGFKLAMEQVQDFINAYGLKVFTEEFDRLMDCYTNMELRALITNKLVYEELSYDEDIPMPDEKSLQFGVLNFMGRLMVEILRITNPKTTVYVESTLGFYDNQGNDIFNMKTVSLLRRCVGISGLNGLDKLLCQNISLEIKNLNAIINKDMSEDNRRLIESLTKQIKILTSFDESYEKIYKQLMKLEKSLITQILGPLQRIGQFVTIRRLFALHLSMKAKVGSTKLFMALETINDSILNDVRNRQYNEQMEVDVNIQMENMLLYDLTKLFNYVGITDPIRKVYLLTEMPDFTPLVMALTLMNQLPLMDYDPKVNTLIRRVKERELLYEPNYLLFGMIVYLNQFNQAHSEIFISYLSHYIKSTINFLLLSKEIQKQNELLSDFFMLLQVVEEIFRYKEDNYEVILIMSVEFQVVVAIWIDKSPKQIIDQVIISMTDNNQYAQMYPSQTPAQLFYKMPDIQPGQCTICGFSDRYDDTRVGNGSYALAAILLPIALCWLPFIVKDCQNKLRRCGKCNAIQEEQPFWC